MTRQPDLQNVRLEAWQPIGDHCLPQVGFGMMSKIMSPPSVIAKAGRQKQGFWMAGWSNAGSRRCRQGQLWRHFAL
jgi:hypothetical protein